MMEQNSIDNLAILQVTLIMTEQTAANEEMKIAMKACRKMVEKVAINEGVTVDLAEAMNKFVGDVDSALDRMNTMSEANRKLLIEHSWEDVKRRVQ